MPLHKIVSGVVGLTLTIALSACPSGPTFPEQITVSELIPTAPPDNLSQGAVQNFAYRVSDGTAHEWTLGAAGAVLDGEHLPSRTDDAFDNYLQLVVGGSAFPSLTMADLEDNRAVVYGPESLGQLNLTRKVFVSPSLGFARWLDILDNPSNANVMVEVRHLGNLGSHENFDTVFMTTSGEGVLEPGDTWFTNCVHGDELPCVGHWWCGAEPTKRMDIVELDYGTINVPANDRAVLISFALMRTSPDGYGVALGELGETLRDLDEFPLVDSRYLAGMRPEELNDLFPECGGAIELEGAPGSVGGGATVTVTNTATGESEMTTANSDGFWEIAVRGTGGDSFMVSASTGESAMVSAPA